MEQETGTARELDLQVGDVVEHEMSGIQYEIVYYAGALSFKSLSGGWIGITVDESHQAYTVISRASTPETGTLAELGVKPGDVVEFVEGYSGLYPEYVGTTSVVDDYGGTERRNDGSQGFSGSSRHKWRIVSRAKPLEEVAHKSPTCGWQDATHTPPQRYVVLTDDDTIICTRSEAEDLAAAGGVDSVYKLGDKVTVTVKVELNDEV